MIVPMKKIFIVTQDHDQWQALYVLRDAGMVHIEPLQTPGGRKLEEIRNDIDRLKETIRILEDYEQQEPQDKGDWKDIVQEVLQKKDESETIQERRRQRQMLLKQWEPWGDFNPDDIHKLAEHGIDLQLVELSPGEWRSLKSPPDVLIIPISESKDLVRIVTVSRKKLELPLRRLVLPCAGIAELKAEESQDAATLRQNQKRLEELAKTVPALQKILTRLTQDEHLQTIAAATGHEAGLRILKGYIPVDAVAPLTQLAKNHQWGMSIEDPSDEDHPPTLIRNPRWIEMIKPVFKFMNSIPGYRELDVSLFFLIFLSIFFGILIGDAGYGILFILMAAIAQKKLRPQMPASLTFYLIYSMSALAIIWGLLTGTFFGTKLFGIKPLFPWLTLNPNVQLVCFLLGAIHLSIAHVWRAINRLNSVTALAEIGWLMIVWACFFFTRLLILNQPLPKFINIFLIVGPGLVILFNQPRKNILAGMGLGLGDFLLNVMSFFGDAVSYIRLFAVGLAGVSVADAFNQMALSAGFTKLPMALLAIVILVVGHALNMVLALFGVLVHGIRLNLLEFSSHLGMEWTGKEYDPLRK